MPDRRFQRSLWVRAGFAEISNYARYFVSLQVDRAKLAGKRLIFFAVLGILALVVLAGFLAVGTGLLLVGLAGVIGQVLGSFWIGATIVGALMFIVPAIGALIVWNMLNTREKKATERKYAKLREEQKHRFGQDVREAAHG